MFTRTILFALTVLVLAGCYTIIDTEVRHHQNPPTGYLTHSQKRQAAIHTYGHHINLTRQEIVGARHRVTERLLLGHYRSTPHDVMCFRKRSIGGSKVIFCSHHRQLDYLLRSRHYPYGSRTAAFTLAPEYPFLEDPVYTSFPIRSGYYGYRGRRW